VHHRIRDQGKDSTDDGFLVCCWPGSRFCDALAGELRVRCPNAQVGQG
jgi:hypothetical protein